MPQSGRRYRKTAILTAQGLQKLEAAKSVHVAGNPYLHPRTYTLEALSELTGLSPHTLSKIHSGKSGVDRRTLIRYFTAFNLTLEPEDYLQPSPRSVANQLDPKTAAVSKDSYPEVPLCASPIVSWGLAPDVSWFYGRTRELATLKQWILRDRCRLISLLGLGGVGKTYLATKLAEQIQSEFKFVIWRSWPSLERSSLPLPNFLDDLISQLSPDQAASTPDYRLVKVQHLINLLSQMPCLLVLDAVESVLPSPSLSADFSCSNYPLTGQSLLSHEAYCDLIKHLGSARHQSCILLTSREEPQLFRLMAGHPSGIRSLSLRGLSIADIQQFFAVYGDFQATPADWQRLVEYYDGNPLMLGIVARTIQRLFHGNITDFLEQKTLILKPIRELLDQHWQSLCSPEKAIMISLAVQPLPLSLTELRSHLSSILSFPDLLEALSTLQMRSLINRTVTQISLPALIRDYINEYIDGY